MTLTWSAEIYYLMNCNCNANCVPFRVYKICFNELFLTPNFLSEIVNVVKRLRRFQMKNLYEISKNCYF